MSEKRKCLYISSDGVKVYASKNIESIKTAKNLSKLNTARGGAKGFKGFTAEHKVAEAMNHNYIEKGSFRRAVVADDNGLADILIKDTKGKVIGKKQVKFTKKAPNVSKYARDNQTIVVPKDASSQMVKNVKKQGASARRSSVTNSEAERLAKAMKREGEITKTNRSRVVPATEAGKTLMKNCHQSGVTSAIKGAAFGGGLSAGSNIVEVIKGDKDIDEAVVDVAVDTVVAGGVGYVGGAALTAVASTAPGAAVVSAVGTAGTAIASTTVGTAVVTGVAATSAAISTGTAAVIGTTLAGTTLGVATVAAAPVVLVGVLIGGICSLLD